MIEVDDDDGRILMYVDVARGSECMQNVLLIPFRCLISIVLMMNTSEYTLLQMNLFIQQFCLFLYPSSYGNEASVSFAVKDKVFFSVGRNLQ